MNKIWPTSQKGSPSLVLDMRIFVKSGDICNVVIFWQYRSPIGPNWKQLWKFYQSRNKLFRAEAKLIKPIEIDRRIKRFSIRITRDLEKMELINLISERLRIIVTPVLLKIGEDLHAFDFRRLIYHAFQLDRLASRNNRLKRERRHVRSHLTIEKNVLLKLFFRQKSK